MDNGRDAEMTRTQLTSWFAAKCHGSDVSVSDLQIPPAGFSNETLFMDVQWVDKAAERHFDSVVVRIEPTTHVVFMTPNVGLQAQVMTALGQHSAVPVPAVI